MELPRAYERVTGSFDLWSRLMERQLRERAAARWDGRGPVAVASPPTDCGVGLVAQRRRAGRVHLLCFSPASLRAAQRVLQAGLIEGVEPMAAEYFELPFEDGSLAAFFANCFFDYVAEAKMTGVLREIARALAPGGLLLGAYLRPPAALRERAWVAALAALGDRAGSVHPVQIDAALDAVGLDLELARDLRSRGCPIREIVAMRRAA